jgi:hypothetical protein
MKLPVLIFFVLSSIPGISQDQLKLSIKEKGVSAVRHSPDNLYFVLANGKEAELYNAGNDTKIKDFTGAYKNFKNGHTREILDFAFANSSSLMASAGADKLIKLWKLPSGELTATFEGHDADVTDVCFADNDQYLISASDDMTVAVWEIKSGKKLYSKKEHQKPIRALDVSVDGKYFATGSGDQHVIIWETASGNVVKKFKAHENWVRTVAFSPDGKSLASGGDDGKIIVWEIPSGNKLKEFPHRGWVYDIEYTADSKYLSAALEKNGVAFYNLSTGLPALKLDDFSNPVLDISISPGGKEVATVEEYGTAVKFWNIESLNISPMFRLKDGKDKTPPQIYVSNPPNIQNNRVTIFKDYIDIRGSVIDESGVRKLRVNNIETPLKENGNFVINLPLGVGDNPVTMEVSDINDNIALKKFTIVRKNMDGEEYNPANAKNFLLVIGINNYLHWPKLNNAVKDANDVASTLMTKYNFEFDNIVTLKDEQATRNNIYLSLRGLIEKVSPQDNLMVYYSGHGYFDQLLNEGYWVPVDAHVNASGDYVSNTEILRIINNINSQHTFLVADACFSGSLFGEATRGYTDNVEKFRSRWGFASGRLEVVSDGSVGDNSPFTKSFVQFLKENQKEKLAVSELIQHVKVKVAETTNQTPLGNPLKNAGDEGGEFVFYKRQ